MFTEDLMLGLAGLAAAAALPLLVTWLFLAFVGSHVASARGRGSGAWFLMTLLLGPLAILLLALFPVDSDVLEARQVKQSLKGWCPFCRRAIPAKAIKCCFCHSIISPLAEIRRQLDLKEAEEAGTPRDGIRKTQANLGHPRVDIDVISQAVHLCGGGVPPDKVAAQLDVSEENVRSWITLYMEDDAWMRRVDMAASHNVN